MRVLVTRPEPGAGRTAEELRRRGFEPVVMPLSRTVPLEQNRATLERCRAAAFAVTSAAAVRHWSAEPLADHLLRIPIYAVGEVTAAAARAAGFSDIKTGDGAGTDLASRIARDVTAGALAVTGADPLVYVAGRQRSTGFETHLKECQVPFTVTEVYDIEEISYLPDFLIRQFSLVETVAALLYSGNAARLLFNGLSGHISDKSIKKGHFLCLSEQVATAVPQALRTQVRVATTPRESALLDLLEGLRHGA